MTSNLLEQHCEPCQGGALPLDSSAIQARRGQLHERWQVEGGKRLVARFEFRNYWETTAFINAAAWIAHREDHHPDISFGYKTCTIAYWTHTVDGLSNNDFICAAKIDALLK